MQPYGRIKYYNGRYKTDCHPRKGYMNWWEDVCDYVSRKTLKQLWKKNLENDEKY